MTAEFFPNSDLRLCEFQSHLIPPDLQFYPYIDISWQEDDDTPTIEVWTRSSVPATENWDEVTDETTNPWGEGEESPEGVWSESEKPTTINWR